MRFALAAFVLLLVSGLASAREVSLLTFQPGEVYWQRYGHNALLVTEVDGRTRLYNYGVFDFQQQNFALNFARGRMQYRLVEEPLGRALWSYQAEQRWVREQRLALSPARAAALADFLAWNARPENAEYRYDYFQANCSTRVRDALDRATDGALSLALKGVPTGVSHRQEAARMMQGLTPMLLLTDLLMGLPVDRPIDLWERSFLPEVLMAAVRQVEVDGSPLVAQEREWLSSTRADTPETTPALTGPMALTGGVLALLLAALAGRRGAPGLAGRGLGLLLALVSGLTGCVLALGWAFTDHTVMAANQGLLWFTPLALLLLPTLWRGRPSGLARGVALLNVAGVLLALAVHALPLPAQGGLHWILFWLPLHLALLRQVTRPAL